MVLSLIKGNNFSMNACVWQSKKHDYNKNGTTGQKDGKTDAGQSEPHVLLSFAGNTKRNDFSMYDSPLP